MITFNSLMVGRTFIVGLLEDLLLLGAADLSELSTMDRRFVRVLQQFDIGYPAYIQLAAGVDLLYGRSSKCSPYAVKRLAFCVLAAFQE